MILIHTIIRNHTKTQGSPNVYINNKPAHRLGDSDSRGDVMINGSSTVFINNKKATRVGDSDSRGNVTTSGSSNVFIGG